MIIGVMKETHPREDRVALIPVHAATLIKKGFTVMLEKHAGLAAGYPDEAYTSLGVKIVDSSTILLQQAQLICVVRAGASHHQGAQLAQAMTPQQILVGLLEPYQPHPSFSTFQEKKVAAFALELIPRTTKAQAMDVLSSMANLAGYKAVIIASYYAKKIFPMMMTAAGTIVPAKVLILGVGVAGLQAIATAKRLGAVVSAYDVRAEVKEQVESLGAKFVVLPLENASTASGYAKTMDAAYYQKQQALLQAVVQVQDVVITTANIPGKKAPILLTKAMVEALSPGSVIVDLAAERGGNCELTQLGKVIDHQGVTIVGIENVPAQLAYNAAALYSKNMVTFIDNLIKTTSDGFQIQWQDDIVQATLLTKEGQLVHPQATQWLTKGGN
jgi:NAD(P) transhydrogenase subunit alpha